MTSAAFLKGGRAGQGEAGTLLHYFCKGAKDGAERQPRKVQAQAQDT